MLIRSRAPLRLSFGGGGTDVPPYPEKEGGCVLSTTIDKYAYGTLRPTKSRKIEIESLDYGISINYGMSENPVYDGKLDLIKAAIQKLEGQDSAGFNLFLHCDAPPGTGLGSSSTMMVAVVGLLKEFKNLPLTDYEIADLAYVIERQDLKIKGGLQDHYAATFGGFNFIEFFKDKVIVNPLRINQDVISELEYNLLLCYTGATRLSAQIIDDQMHRFETGEEESMEGMRNLKQIAIEMKNALLRGRLNEFGDLLHQSWENKKRMSAKITNPEIDEIYELARKAGALGGKVTGAGGGGHFILYCPYNKKHKVAEKIKEKGGVISDFSFTPYGLRTWRVQE